MIPTKRLPCVMIKDHHPRKWVVRFLMLVVVWEGHLGAHRDLMRSLDRASRGRLFCWHPLGDGATSLRLGGLWGVLTK